MYQSDDFFESLGLEFSEMGERLAVEAEVGLLGGAHELGIGHAVLAEGGIDLDVPEAAEVALLVAAMGKRVGAGMGESFVGGALGLGAAETEALGLLEDLAAILECVYCFFYTGHVG